MDALPEAARWLLAAPIYACAYGAAILVFRWMARRRGLDTSGVRILMLAGLFGGLLGANLIQLLLAGSPGKTIEGGIVGGFVAVLWMKRRLGITRPVGDLFAPAIALGEAIGRIGCFVGGCCYGKVASLAWAVHDHDELRHPTQLYASGGAALTFAALIVLERKRILPENGLFYVQIVLFCSLRFAVEFVRAGDVTAAGLTLAQLGCIAGMTYALWKLRPLLARPVTAHAA